MLPGYRLAWPPPFPAFLVSNHFPSVGGFTLRQVCELVRSFHRELSSCRFHWCRPFGPRFHISSQFGVLRSWVGRMLGRPERETVPKSSQVLPLVIGFLLSLGIGAFATVFAMQPAPTAGCDCRAPGLEKSLGPWQAKALVEQRKGPNLSGRCVALPSPPGNHPTECRVPRRCRPPSIPCRLGVVSRCGGSLLTTNP